MTKRQGNIIIVLLLAAVFLLLLLAYNLFNGLAVMNYKIDKTQALVEKALAAPPTPPVQTKKSNN